MANPTQIRLMALSALTALALGWSSGSRADIELTLGVYAYDQPTRVLWSCASVVRAMERKIGHALDEEVDIQVELDEDYNRGVAAVTMGQVQLARFPNVDTFWVVHPGLERRVLGAWRDAMSSLSMEDILVGWGTNVAALGSASALSTQSVVEERFGDCGEFLEQAKADARHSDQLVFGYEPFFVYSGAPAFDSPVDMINALPATAAGARASDGAGPTQQRRAGECDGASGSTERAQ